jgi:hypothetical protein
MESPLRNAIPATLFSLGFVAAAYCQQTLHVAAILSKRLAEGISSACIVTQVEERAAGAIPSMIPVLKAGTQDAVWHEQSAQGFPRLLVTQQCMDGVESK